MIKFINFKICFDTQQDIKSEATTEDDQDDDDVVIMTPIDEWIPHKPTETKYDTLTGFIPFKLNVSYLPFYPQKLLILKLENIFNKI